MPLELVQQVAHKARVPATVMITDPYSSIIIQSDRNDVVVDRSDYDVLSETLREVQAQMVGVVHLDTTQAG